MKFSQFLNVIAFMAVVNTAQSQDYCNINLCKGRKHVACNNSGVSLFIFCRKSNTEIDK